MTTFERPTSAFHAGPFSLTLVRHGEATWSRSGRSVDDPNLSEIGIQECHRLRQRLGGLRFDGAFASPALRARETARIAWESSAEIPTLDWLAEIRYPQWEGKTDLHAATQLAAIRKATVIDRMEPFGGPGGERMSEFAGRVAGGLAELLEARNLIPRVQSGHRVWRFTGPTPQHLLLFAHAGTINCIIGRLLDMPRVPWEWERIQIPNASVTVLQTLPVGQDFAFTLERVGDVSGALSVR